MSNIHHERGRLAALTRFRKPDDPDLVDAKRRLESAKINAYVEKVLAQAPPLTDEQRAKLAELLKPVRRAPALPSNRDLGPEGSHDGGAA